jgi:hypothetical protein
MWGEIGLGIWRGILWTWGEMWVCVDGWMDGSGWN